MDFVSGATGGACAINSADIISFRLHNQQIAATKFKHAKEIVGWMGAMQAQDYPMAKWAIGVRLPHSADTAVQASIDNGEILRTHLLRPTWHFVSAENIAWMLELTAPRIKAAMKFREKWLGLTKATFAKSNRIIEKALTANGQMTREELIAELHKASVRIDGNRASHLLMRAELDGIICSGRMNGKKQTYALLKRRVPKKKTLSRDESLRRLAHIFFSSRAPATVRDFAWWSGLSMIEAKGALEMIKPDFVPEIVDGNTFWHPDSALPPLRRTSAFLLPAFDEFLIGYNDRSAAIDDGIERKLIHENGIFRPVIVIDGQVSGLWRRTMNEDGLTVETRLFRVHTKKERIEIHRAAERFCEFLGVRMTECNIDD
jgi:hypothetical protein